jgi:hypothetical protein
MDILNQFVQTLQAAGLPGLLFAVLVLTGVFAAKRGKLVVTGDQARIANLALGVISAVLAPGADSEKALTGAIASVLSALVYEGLDWLRTKYFAKG